MCEVCVRVHILCEGEGMCDTEGVVYEGVCGVCAIM